MNKTQLNDKLYKLLLDEDYFDIRTIEGVGICALQRMAFTVGLFVNLDEYGYTYRYCYKHLADAREALKNWDGKEHPSGDWIKRKGDGGDLVNPASQEAIVTLRKKSSYAEDYAEDII